MNHHCATTIRNIAFFVLNRGAIGSKFQGREILAVIVSGQLLGVEDNISVTKLPRN